MKDKILKLSGDYNLYKEEFKENKYFLFNVVEGSIYNMNETSHSMLALFDGKKNVAEVEKILLTMYNTTETELKEDFLNLVSVWITDEILIDGGSK